MLIYFNGDSNTAGTELWDLEQGYAAKLAKKLGASSVVNDAMAGCSNMRIIRSTESFLRDCATRDQYPDFMVIGWSSFEREEWWSDEYSQLISLNTHVFAFDDIKKTDRYQHWLAHQALDNHYNIQMAKFYNTQIYNLHQELRSKNIRHLFFPAIWSLAYFEARVEHKPYASVYRLDWHHNFVAPYEENFSMINWLAERGHEEITPGQRHYAEPAQEEWARYLETYIREHDLLA